MLATESEKIRSEIHELVDKHGRERSSLLPILQAIQHKYSHVPDFAMQEIADLLGIYPVEVYSVVSFYSFLDEEPKAKLVIRLCRTLSCDMAGKNQIARQLENDLGIKFGESTSDGMFHLEWANCIGMCDQGPALLVNEMIYTKVTPSQVSEIIQDSKRAYFEAQSRKKEAHH
jgi:NADH:ubiquinone oxidoreductase subunit E